MNNNPCPIHDNPGYQGPHVIAQVTAQIKDVLGPMPNTPDQHLHATLVLEDIRSRVSQEVNRRRALGQQPQQIGGCLPEIVALALRGTKGQPSLN